MGTDQLRKDRAFQLLTDPRVAPYVNQQTVVDKFVLEEFSDGDPDEFKKQPGQDQSSLLGAAMQPGGQALQVNQQAQQLAQLPQQ